MMDKLELGVIAIAGLFMILGVVSNQYIFFAIGLISGDLVGSIMLVRYLSLALPTSSFNMDLGHGLSYHIFVNCNGHQVKVTDAFAVSYPMSLVSKLLEKLTEIKRKEVKG